MNSRSCLLLMALVLMSGVVWSQPVLPDTFGVVDTVALEVTVNEPAGQVTVEMYLFNDSNLLAGSAGFSWGQSSATLLMDTAYGSPLVDAGFGIGPFFYEADDFSTTNANQRFLFGASHDATTDGVAGDAGGRRWWATYEFSLSDWNEGDSIVFDTLSFNPGSAYVFFVELPGPGQQAIQPHWEGRVVIIKTGGVIPTNEWINAYCEFPILNDVPLNPGDTIKAYDPDGVLCGLDVVRADGTYGFMPIYRDDASTPTQDEGAEPGDIIVFGINDEMVATEPAVFWTTNGDVVEVCDFSTEIVRPTNEWINVYCGAPLFNGVPLSPGDLVRAYDPDGVLCGLDTVRADGKFGFMPIYHDDIFSAIDEGAETGDTITFFINDTEVQTDPVVVWISNGYSYELCDFFTCKKFHLEAGWHLISWNLDYGDDIEDFISLLGPDTGCVEVMLGFDRGAMTYDPDYPTFSTLNYVDYHFGYWILLSCPVDFDICGDRINPEDYIHIYDGWNLVSYWPRDPLPVETALVSIYDDIMVVLGYDGTGLTHIPSEGPFNTLTEMEACLGYWIKTTSDGMLLYPGWTGPLAAARIGDPVATTTDIAPTNTWISIFGNDITLDGRPLAPNTKVEAFTEDGHLCGRGHYVDGLLKFTPVYGHDKTQEKSSHYPQAGERIEIRINGQPVSPTVTWTENGDRVRLERLSSSGEGSGLPGEFELYQNYPNPFNPTTEISFSLPEPAQVELTVYNIMGQQVAVLANDFFGAGHHTIEWHAADEENRQVASGLYLYRLRAGDFVETKKMMLLK